MVLKQRMQRTIEEQRNERAKKGKRSESWRGGGEQRAGAAPQTTTVEKTNPRKSKTLKLRQGRMGSGQLCKGVEGWPNQPRESDETRLRESERELAGGWNLLAGLELGRSSDRPGRCHFIMTPSLGSIPSTTVLWMYTVYAFGGVPDPVQRRLQAQLYAAIQYQAYYCSSRRYHKLLTKLCARREFEIGIRVANRSD
ncbi:hypothetical protein BDW71DRAFT_3358 [Aspergillus fruticulosus]